jgi:hypothetical protein
MADLISDVRLKIFDLAGANQQFSDQNIQNRLDAWRDDIRYESLTIAPSIVNNTLTGNQATTIFADYYSKYQWWEVDATTGDGVFLQGYQNGAAWVLLTPTSFEPITGHWQFENNVFTSGTSVPGQLPPVFATGKIYDPYAAAADLLEYWAAALANRFDVTADGQTLRRSQLMANKITLAGLYRRQCKPRIAKMVRSDVQPPMDTVRMRLLDSGDLVK